MQKRPKINDQLMFIASVGALVALIIDYGYPDHFDISKFRLKVQQAGSFGSDTNSQFKLLVFTIDLVDYK